MNHKKYTDANRRAWDEVTPYHQRAKAGKFFQAFRTPGYSSLDQHVTAKLREVGLAGKRVVQIACNDGRETLSLKNLGAASVVGIDISSAAIDEARKLSSDSGVPGEFICSDIYELNPATLEPADLCFITIGCFGWMPDLDEFFGKVSRLIKPHGQILIYEQHPFVEMFDGGKPNPQLQIEQSYFKTEPYADEEGLDYWGNVEYKGPLNYWFVHKLSDIFMGLLRNRFQIQDFTEYPHDISNVHAGLENDRIKLPLSMIVVAAKVD